MDQNRPRPLLVKIYIQRQSKAERRVIPFWILGWIAAAPLRRYSLPPTASVTLRPTAKSAALSGAAT